MKHKIIKASNIIYLFIYFILFIFIFIYNIRDIYCLELFCDDKLKDIKCLLIILRKKRLVQNNNEKKSLCVNVVFIFDVFQKFF